jgi:hypothetical protein
MAHCQSEGGAEALLHPPASPSPDSRPTPWRIPTPSPSRLVWPSFADAIADDAPGARRPAHERAPRPASQRRQPTPPLPLAVMPAAVSRGVTAARSGPLPHPHPHPLSLGGRSRLQRHSSAPFRVPHHHPVQVVVRRPGRPRRRRPRRLREGGPTPREGGGGCAVAVAGGAAPGPRGAARNPNPGLNRP